MCRRRSERRRDLIAALVLFVVLAGGASLALIAR
jgi:hypothetical protein